MAKKIDQLEYDKFGGDDNNRTFVKTEGTSTPYAIKMTTVGDYTYVAKALVGSDEADGVWQAQRLDKSAGLTITWADGDNKFDNIATDLTALTYS